MMLRSLVDEVVRRRLWPVALVALLVIVAAPLLFMKSAPPDAPAASDAPPVAAPGKLPARAANLLKTSDRNATPRRRATSGSQDPFAPPASARAATEAVNAPAQKSAPSSSSGAPKQTKPVEVVIKNPDGSAPKAQSSPSTPQAPAPSGDGEGRTYSASAGESRLPTVDVRFGEQAGTKTHRKVPRLGMFRVATKPVAVFVKYSPSRKKAVFAIAPSTIVSGDVECRRKAGLCRFVDIPVGKHARLTVVTEDGSLVTRRLDVVRVNRGR